MSMVFCSDPLNPAVVDEPYAREFTAASQVGLASSLFNYEALVNDGDVDRAIRRIPSPAIPGIAVYRGWMLRPPLYARLQAALLERGIRLVNEPAAYSYAHELPNWYPDFTDVTPRTVIVPLGGPPDFAAILMALRDFGNSPVVLKDYVKSQKHYWNEACFIPDASDGAAVERVTARFLELQGDGLAGGLVYRSFVELEPIGIHPKSGLTLTREYRVFCFDGKPLCVLPYWEDAEYRGETPPLDQLNKMAARVKSRFFTMDVAKAREGHWILVELGDGQVAGLPDQANVLEFYSALSDRLRRG
ncbi:MAG TPA: ATP-grasp domain-containing protein [Planctomycetota bacterium]|nr:ATP-grasp domain-containing protein [Planctomycetota bacterium]